MNATDILGYTADADVWCPDCAWEAYGAIACGKCPKCDAYIFPAVKMECLKCGEPFTQKQLEDHEGNELHPIFCGDMGQWEEVPVCGKCHEALWEE